MAAAFIRRGYRIVSGGTDNHLFLLDLIARNVTGKDADAALGAAHITVNKNAVPNDPRPPMITSGLRIGTPAVTTRGFREAEVERLADLISDLLDNLAARAHLGSADGKGGVTAEPAVVARVRGEVEAICRRFPVYRRA
jgi:glycine hydroxymethyltransferase